jgi:quercetin dioxygenase-like cupin family protein
MRLAVALPFAAVAFALASTPAIPQSGKMHRSTLQDVPFPGPTYHTVTVKAEVDAGGEVPRHTHPGIEMAYVVSGEAILVAKGQPDRHLTAGDSFSIPQGEIHSVKNAGTGTLVLVSTYVVKQGQPLLSPAP